MLGGISRWLQPKTSQRSVTESKLPVDNFRAWRVNTFSPPEAKIQPKLILNVPSYGVIFMNPPEEARTYAQINGVPPAYDQLLHGDLEIQLPPEYPMIRCKSVCIRFEAVSKLNMGVGRGEEEDVLFEREVKIQEGEEGIVVEHGQKFAFTLILPSTLAPRTWTPDGVIKNHLYARLEGLPLKNSPETNRTQPKSKSRSRSNSPPNNPPSAMSSLMSSVGKPNGSVEIPQPPTYYEGTDVWLEGTHTAEMNIRLIYNPDPAGGTNVLKEESKGVIPGFGAYEVHFLSDVWTIACLLQTNVMLSELSPDVTVYSLRIFLHQTHRIRSPRDSLNGKELVGQKRLLLVEKGQTPDLTHVFPPADHPALWKGVGAGGNDDGPLIIETQGRVEENDHNCRPSTLPSVETPIRISHSLDVDIYFSVYGTGSDGQKLRISGPGGSRRMRIRKPVMLPTCAIQPQTVTLPDYEHPEAFYIQADPLQALHPWRVCACWESTEKLMQRMQESARSEEAAAREAEAAAPHLKD